MRAYFRTRIVQQGMVHEAELVIQCEDPGVEDLITTAHGTDEGAALRAVLLLWGAQLDVEREEDPS